MGVTGLAFGASGYGNYKLYISMYPGGILALTTSGVGTGKRRPMRTIGVSSYVTYTFYTAVYPSYVVAMRE